MAERLRLPATDAIALELMDAIRKGDTAKLEQRLRDRAELVGARIVDERSVGRTLLHIVADWPGHFPNGASTVAVLAAAGADVNAVVEHASGSGAPETPLHWSASTNDVAVLDALLDAGADIEAPGAIFTGGSPMSDAVIFAQWRAATRLLERGASVTLWQAAALGLLARVKAMCAESPAPTPEHMTNAFWHACRGGQLGVAQFLAGQGANPQWVGHDRKTALDVAREAGADELVAWLRSIGATPSARH